MATQHRPRSITDESGSVSVIRTSYRVCRDYDDPVMLHVGTDGRIWIGYGTEPSRYSHVANVGDRGTEGTSREAICRAANQW